MSICVVKNAFIWPVDPHVGELYPGHLFPAVTIVELDKNADSDVLEKLAMWWGATLARGSQIGFVVPTSLRRNWSVFRVHGLGNMVPLFDSIESAIVQLTSGKSKEK